MIRGNSYHVMFAFIFISVTALSISGAVFCSWLLLRAVFWMIEPKRAAGPPRRQPEIAAEALPLVAKPVLVK